MERTDYREIDRNGYTVHKEAKFKCDLFGEVYTFSDIIDKFINYNFEEHLDSLREEFNCQSVSNIIYYLSILNGNKGLFFDRFLGARLEIPGRNEIDLVTYPIRFELENPKEKINDILKNKMYDSVIIKAEMDIKFYIHRNFNMLDQYEEEADEGISDDDDDDTIPAIIESPFISDNCSICLSEKPNILNIPCLHLSVCSSCEETGKLLRCSVCRKKIERKIKI